MTTDGEIKHKGEKGSAFKVRVVQAVRWLNPSTASGTFPFKEGYIECFGDDAFQGILNSFRKYICLTPTWRAEPRR